MSLMSDEIFNLYNKFTKIHNQFNAIKRSYKLNGTDINPSELQVLSLINTGSNITITTLAKEFYMTKSAASQAIKKLSNKGLIIKTRSIENERNVNLEITEEGKSIITNFFNDTNNPLHVFINNYKDMPNSEIEVIKNFLSNLEEMFENKLK